MLLCPAIAAAQNEPVVLVGAERQSCSGSVCQWQAGTGNGVIIEATSRRLVVATAGHNVYQGRNVSVYVSRQWTPATRHHAEYSTQADFGIVIVEGDYSQVPAATIHAAPLPYGVPVSIDGYWPGQPKWLFRRLSLRRMMNRILGDSLDQPVTQGVSGAPVMYQGQVAGIVVGIDQPTIGRSSVTYFTPAARMRELIASWGVTVSPKEIAAVEPQANLLIKEPLPAESPVEAPERQASSDAPASRSGGASEQLLPAEELPHDVAESPRGTDAPLPHTSRVKEWAWDGLSAWAWAAIGAGVAGPLGWAIPVAGRVVHRRLKSKRGGDPVSILPGDRPAENHAECPICDQWRTQYHELEGIVSELQKRLAASKDNVVLVQSHRDHQAWQQALTGVIKRYPDDQRVTQIVQMIREFQRQYLSGS